jgi:hypothetical protein
MNPWVDGNDLTKEISYWYNEKEELIVEYRWRDADSTVHVNNATGEIVGFGSTTK